MRAKQRVMVILGTLSLVALMAVVLMLHEVKSEVPLDQLLLSGAAFPDRWRSDTFEVEAQWTMEAGDRSTPGELRSFANLARTWTPGRGSPRITQQIYQYDSVAGAIINFWLARPEWLYGRKWPNFNTPELRVRRYPAAWPREWVSADAARIVCAMGDLTSCQTWYFWGRYGQYVMKIEFWGPNQGMDAETFMKIVTPCDGVLTGELGR